MEIKETHNKAGWSTEIPEPVITPETEITEEDVLRALLRLLEDSPELTGYILTGIEVGDLLNA